MEEGISTNTNILKIERNKTLPFEMYFLIISTKNYHLVKALSKYYMPTIFSVQHTSIYDLLFISINLYLIPQQIQVYFINSIEHFLSVLSSVFNEFIIISVSCVSSSHRRRQETGMCVHIAAGFKEKDASA